MVLFSRLRAALELRSGLMYGPPETSVEQINNTTEKVTYLHHDQQGSARAPSKAPTPTPYGAPKATGTAGSPRFVRPDRALRSTFGHC